jgi:hypothetical protein
MQQQQCLLLLVRLLQPQILELDPRGIATMLYCLGRLGFKDPDLVGFVGDLLHLSTEMINSGAMRPRELGTLAWALPRLQDVALWVNPSRRWWSCFFTACDRQWQGFSAEGLAHVGWGLGRLRRAPGEDWVLGYCEAVEGQLAGFTAQGLVMVVWGVARMGGKPYGPWMKRWCGALGRHLPNLNSQQLSMTWW